MLSRKELNEKKRYILERLKGKNSEVEEANLKSTLASIIILEMDNDRLKNVRLFNLANALSKNKLEVKRTSDLNAKYADVYEKLKSPIDDEYLSFLLQLAQNV